MSKEIDVKIGTPNEAKWTKVKDQAVKAIEANETELEINKEILSLAERKIQAEIESIK